MQWSDAVCCDVSATKRERWARVSGGSDKTDTDTHETVGGLKGVKETAVKAAALKGVTVLEVTTAALRGVTVLKMAGAALRGLTCRAQSANGCTRVKHSATSD